MATIDKNGITGKTLTQYLEDVRTRYRAIDASWNLDPSSPDGQAVAIWSELLANLDEVVQYAYMSRDPATAQGQALDDIASINNIERQEKTSSTVTLVLSGTDGTLIPAGSRVRSKVDGYLWAINGNTILTNGTATVTATSVTTGAVAANVGQVSSIADPVAGWQSATNPAAAIVGSDAESDTDFRIRRRDSVAINGANQVDSIYGAIANVDGVTKSKIYENSESSPDENGIDGHSMAIFVAGGSDEDVLTAIASRKNPGCGLNRNNNIPNKVLRTAITPGGNPVDITFFRPEAVTTYVRVEINTSQMAESEKEIIKQEIVDYSVNGFDDGTAFSRRGFDIGEDVSAGRLYTPVNSIVAARGAVDSITVGLGQNPSSVRVNIEFNQLGVINAENIQVVYV